MTFPSMNNPFPVRGGIVSVVAEITRPADTTAYAAKDVICNSASAPVLMTFPGAGRENGSSGYIVGVRVMTDLKTWTASLRLHLYHTAPTPINDNAPFLLLYANNSKKITPIDITNMGTEDAANSTAANGWNMDIRIPFVCAVDSRDLIGIIETKDAFTPASGQKFYVELMIDQN